MAENVDNYVPVSARDIKIKADTIMAKTPIHFESLTHHVVHSTFQSLVSTLNEYQDQIGKGENAINFTFTQKVDLRAVDRNQYHNVATLMVSTDNDATRSRLAEKGDLRFIFNDEVSRLIGDATLDMLYDNGIQTRGLGLYPFNIAIRDNISEEIIAKEDIKAFPNNGTIEGSIKEYMDSVLTEYKDKKIGKQ